MSSRPLNGDANGGQRRRRGAARLSCAECRRLKLRCDRKVPCESCVKRGCGAICPDGSLTTGKGNRFVLASTQDLHEKISELSSRVRDLEDALRDSHRQLSDDSHPLLAEDLLRIKAPLERESNSDSPRGTNGIKEEPGHDVVDSFGSLSISYTGKQKFYGHTANSWYFLQNEEIEEELEDRSAALETMLPPEIMALGSNFPTSPTSSPITNRHERMTNLMAYLPDLQKATQLRDIYFQRAAWMYNPISREQFNEDVFQRFYGPGTSIMSAPEDASGTHKLSVMFMVLAIGTLMDPNEEPYNLDAEKYHQLSRAALFKTSMFDDPTLNAVQSLFLMSFYLFLSDRHGTSSGSRWIIMGFAVKVAQSIGLHRDSTRWKIDEHEAHTRRETFWELYTYDSWQCLTFGRPPSFSLQHVDCKFPHPIEDPSGERSFDAWKHRFSSECMNIVHDQAFGAKTASYQTILQLDRKLRAFPVPAVLQIAGFGSSTPNYSPAHPDSLGLIMQRHIVLAIREMNLLYMHRGFFARAISDNPKDPLGSPYGTSVIAAYRSAGSLVALVKNLDSQLPNPTERLWFLWTHLFSCSVVLGSIVTRCPSMSLAPSALVQLDSACELFSKVAKTFRAEKVLGIMLRLNSRAHTHLQEHREGKISPIQSNLPFRAYHEGTPDPEHEDDELAKLGGKTRLISQKDYSKSPSPTPNSLVTRSPNTHNPIVPLPLHGVHTTQMDPTVVDYLQTFQPYGGISQGTASAIAQNGGMSDDYAMYTGSDNILHGASSMGYNGSGAMHFSSSANGLQSLATVAAAAAANDMASPPSSASSSNGPGLPPLLQTSVPSTQTQNYFPQYFPVFDYGNATANNNYSQLQQLQLQTPVSAGGFDHAMNLDGMNGMNGHVQNRTSYMNPSQHDRRESLTPEASMHTTWMDFVNQMSGMQ